MFFQPSASSCEQPFLGKPRPLLGGGRPYVVGDVRGSPHVHAGAVCAHARTGPS
jgi:hypothetical protein